MPKLSIITINLNNAKGLQKTIESVVNQTFKDLEYIVIDGGSTDGSVEIIKKYADKINYWISEPDTGIYNAMNKGIAVAKGEYCLFLNSGDWLYNDTIIESVAGHELFTDIVVGNVLSVNSNYQSHKIAPNSYNITAYKLFTSTLPHQASFIRKELFEKYGNYDENLKIVSDWKFCLETIIIHNVTVKYIDLIISFYDLNGISNKMIEIEETERTKVLHELFPVKIIQDYEYFHKERLAFELLKNDMERENSIYGITKTIRSHLLSRKLQTGIFRIVKAYERIAKKHG